MQILAQEQNTVSKGFKYRLTFFEVERKVDLINNQINIFEYLQEGVKNNE